MSQSDEACILNELITCGSLLLRGRQSDALCLCLQGDIVEQEGDSQSQGSATWLVDPKESKRTISTKYETTIF